ncbi:MAG: hypothetical protein BWY92_01082 [Firmicutes bacterium ADurb.BinA052]|nr:MAG: hypothetical protein BWY92_01082 [Firmicutes bacterium ADurb.BinA052]
MVAGTVLVNVAQVDARAFAHTQTGFQEQSADGVVTKVRTQGLQERLRFVAGDEIELGGVRYFRHFDYLRDVERDIACFQGEGKQAADGGQGAGLTRRRKLQALQVLHVALHVLGGDGAQGLAHNLQEAPYFVFVDAGCILAATGLLLQPQGDQVSIGGGS